jgi:hypothetical protein
MIPDVNGQGGHNLISCSKGTKNGVFHRNSHSVSGGTDLIYENPAGRTIHFTGVYPDQCINRMMETEKWKEVERTAPIRRILIKEMEERLIVLVVVEHFNLHEKFLDKGDRDVSTSHYALTDELEAAIKKATHAETQKKWRTLDPSINLWEMILLEYVCQTGEIRNHQALAAHCYGNISH